MKKLEQILKAGKYKSKKKVNGRWVYDYGDKKGRNKAKSEETKEKMFMELDYNAEKLLDNMRISNSKYKDINKVSVIETPMGNWRLYYDGKDTGLTAPRHKIQMATIKKYNLEK